MTQLANDLPLTPRERLRWRRAMDAQLMESIFGHVVRDATRARLPRIDEAVIAAIVLAPAVETLPTA